MRLRDPLVGPNAQVTTIRRGPRYRAGMRDFRDFENLADPDERSQWLRTAAHELIQQTGEAAGTRTQHYADHQPVWLTWWSDPAEGADEG